MATLARSLADLASQLAALTATRLELFGLEALQARDRLLCRLGVLLAAVVFLLLALLVASLAVALAFWPTEHRILALGLLALVYAGLGAGLLVWLRLGLGRADEPFAATLDVLRADAEALGAGLPSARDGDDPDAGRPPDADMGDAS